MKKILGILAVGIMFNGAANAATTSQTYSLSFEACLAKKESVITQLGINPRDIVPVVNTSIMTMTKLCTADGSVIVTCSKPDRSMVVTKSTNSCR